MPRGYAPPARPWLCVLVCAALCACACAVPFAEVPAAGIQCSASGHQFCVVGWRAWPDSAETLSTLAGMLRNTAGAHVRYFFNPYGPAYNASLQEAHACRSSALPVVIPWGHMIVLAPNVTLTSWCTDAGAILGIERGYGPAFTLMTDGATVSDLVVAFGDTVRAMAASGVAGDDYSLFDAATFAPLLLSGGTPPAAVQSTYYSVRSTPDQRTAIGVTAVRLGPQTMFSGGGNFTNIHLHDLWLFGGHIRAAPAACSASTPFSVDGLTVRAVRVVEAGTTGGYALGVLEAIGTVTVSEISCTIEPAHVNATGSVAVAAAAYMTCLDVVAMSSYNGSLTITAPSDTTVLDLSTAMLQPEACRTPTRRAVALLTPGNAQDVLSYSLVAAAAIILVLIVVTAGLCRHQAATMAHLRHTVGGADVHAAGLSVSAADAALSDITMLRGRPPLANGSAPRAVQRARMHVAQASGALDDDGDDGAATDKADGDSGRGLALGRPGLPAAPPPLALARQHGAGAPRVHQRALPVHSAPPQRPPAQHGGQADGLLDDDAEGFARGL